MISAARYLFDTREELVGEKKLWCFVLIEVVAFLAESIALMRLEVEIRLSFFCL